MKIVNFLVLGAMFFAWQSSWAKCSDSEINKNVKAHADKVASRFMTTFDSVKNYGVIAPGKALDIFVAVDDFTIANNTSEAFELAILRGTNMVGDTFWIAKLNPENCTVLEASELLGQGGAGL